MTDEQVAELRRLEAKATRHLRWAHVWRAGRHDWAWQVRDAIDWHPLVVLAPTGRRRDVQRKARA